MIYKGRVQAENLSKNHMKMEQVRKLLRQEGYYNISQVHHLILEVDGSVTVVPYEKKDEFSVMVIDQGEVDCDVLDELEGKDEEWIMHQLALQSCPLSDVFYGELLADNRLQIIRYRDLEGNELDNIDE
ncbi:YetF domain-containing protein [Hutsoniella sourekii]